MIDDFHDRRKRDLNNLSVGTLHLYTRRSERLRSRHTSDDTSHSISVAGNNLNIWFAIKRPQGRQRFGNFHR